MDDLQVIDIYERVRDLCISECADVHVALQQNHPDTFPTRSNEFFGEQLVALLAGLNANIPSVRRSLQATLTGGVSAVAEACGYPMADEEPDGASSRAARLKSSLQQFDSAPASDNRHYFATTLARAPSVSEAAAQVRQWFPVLSPRASYDYLSRVGYPAAIPSTAVGNFCSAWDCSTHGLLMRIGFRVNCNG